MNNITLVPILFIVVIVIFSYQMMKRKNQKSAIIIGRNTHFKILACYIAVLFTTLVFAEIFYSKINSASPPKKVEYHHGQDHNSIDNQIMNHEPIDPDALIEKRTHPAGQTLSIQWAYDPYEDNSPFIYIERKQTGDQTIEEFIYKPLLIVEEYDFSNALDIAKPVWTDDTMTFPKSPVSDTTIATFFYDAALVQQLTKNPQFQTDDYSYSSEYRSLIIHLKIPADLKIVDTDEDFLFFVD